MEKNVTNNFFYGKNESKIINGVAIILMMIHHFFGFPNWLLPNNSFEYIFPIEQTSIPQILANFGKICVSIYAFNSGFIFGKKKSNFDTIKKRFLRGFNFLISYWSIFILFIIYASITHEKIPLGLNFFFNLIGLNTAPHMPFVNVVFSWYVAFYLFWLISAPLFSKVFNKINKKFHDVILLILICILIKFIIIKIPLLTFISPTGAAITGFLCAKYNTFEWLSSHLKINWWNAILILILLITIRENLALINIVQIGFEDGVLSTIFIFIIISIYTRYKLKKTAALFSFLGIYSMNLWYLHGIFFTGNCNLQWILYLPSFWILILIWGIIILLPLAILCNKLQNLTKNSFTFYSSI